MEQVLMIDLPSERQRTERLRQQLQLQLNLLTRSSQPLLSACRQY
jgi:hypothetical protein